MKNFFVFTYLLLTLTLVNSNNEAYLILQDEVNKINDNFVEEVENIENLEIKYRGGRIP